ncbi:MAG: heat-inducible transcriptional repressor HrcA [Capsulimonadaceae bacterium]|nr:heat-inducible transcriptional repressor HrcA [Capsulimonadaceae bacterium]
MELDERKQRILQGVVWSYVATAEPVGSENLAQRYAWWGVKSATIRNVLADLADLGYLRQPHTSAGRIPSDQGYRFYVNHLIFDAEIGEDIAQQTKADLEQESADNLERILRQTCALLSRMTHYTSVATRPQPADTCLRQVFVAPADARSILLVVLLSTGQSETRLLSGAVAQHADENPSALTAASNTLNALWASKSLQAIACAADADLKPPADLAGDHARAIYTTLVLTLRNVARMAGEDRAVVEGAREMFRQPEFHDLDKLDPVLETIQMQPHFVEAINHGGRGEVSVVIGAENAVEPLKECSVVTASYYIGARERGTLGVVGPTRMDYDRTIPAVSFMARSLSDLLTRLA